MIDFAIFPRRARSEFVLILVLLAAGVRATGQTSAGNSQTLSATPSSAVPIDRSYDVEPAAGSETAFGTDFVRRIAQDQKRFWTFPTRLQTHDLKWIVPGSAVTIGLFASDSWISSQVPGRPNQLTRSQHISDYGLYSLIGAGGGALLFGTIKKNDHMQETGLLAAEAAINATAVTYVLKLVTMRQRPYISSEDGDLFSGKVSGTHLSFPSEHSAIAWSIATVISQEYPRPLAEITSYGVAALVSTTRVTSRQHFPSDVFIGGVIGWYFGREVFRAHHRRNLDQPATEHKGLLRIPEHVLATLAP